MNKSSDRINLLFQAIAELADINYRHGSPEMRYSLELWRDELIRQRTELQKKYGNEEVTFERVDE